MSTAVRPATANLGPSPTRSIPQLLDEFAGGLSPFDVARDSLRAVQDRGSDGVWITVATEAEVLARCAELAALEPAERRALPLYGIPFGVKDSIDVAGWPTTLACPDYAYVATDTAPVVQRILDAGAVLVGKTNLDQFATGLNGTRSPYGIPHSVYGENLISGGSSSGSALAVALGEVPFCVATDTAGSGRVPPALNGIAGYKPSRGLISTVGLVPACRSLDCVSLIATSFADLATLLDVVAEPDVRDPWHRPRRRVEVEPATVRIGLPDAADLDFFGDEPMASAHLAAREAISRAGVTVPIDLAPFLDAGSLLYQGPWVAERLVEFGDFLEEHPGSSVPVVESIIRSGERFSAADAFRAQYRLAELRVQTAAVFATADVVVVPTIGTTFTIDEVLADPIATNTTLGHYTHCGNLLDLCAAAVPAGTTVDGRPASCMVLGPALADDTVLAVAGHLAHLLATESQPFVA